MKIDRQHQMEFTSKLEKFLLTKPTPANIASFVKNEVHLTAGQMARIFIYVTEADRHIPSKIVTREFLASIHQCFVDGVGGGWRAEIKKTYDLHSPAPHAHWETAQIVGVWDTKKNQAIRPDIDRYWKKRACVFCGSRSRLETDHKDGRKDDPRVMNTKTQLISDFQICCKHDNDVKAQVCKKCKETGLRPDARNIPRYADLPFGWTHGDEHYDPKGLRCKGCPYFDPQEFTRDAMLLIKNGNYQIGQHKNFNTHQPTERLNMNITPDTHYFTCSTEVYMKLLECFITHPDKSFQMETLPALVKGHCSGDAARALFGVSSEQCHHEDEAPVKPSSGSTAKKNPGKKPIEVGFQNNHLYRNEKDGCIIECTDNSSFTGNAKFYAFDFTGVVDKPDDDKKKKLKEIQSFSSHYRIIHGTTNGTYWHSKSNEWKDLGLKSEYNPPASVVELAAA